MTTDLAARIRDSLLESPYIGDVLQVTVGTASGGIPITAEGLALVGLRVTVANVPTIGDLGPVAAQFRATAREFAGDDACVFVEIVVSDERNSSVPTEKIVIRGAD